MIDLKSIWDAYHFLELPNGSSMEEVKSAYHKMLHKYNPEKPGGSMDKIKEIQKSYKYLTSLSESDWKDYEKQHKYIARDVIYPPEVKEDMDKKIVKQMKSIESAHKKESFRRALSIIVKHLLWLCLIPISILLWNVHPVLGIICLIIFLYIAYMAVYE